MIKAIIIEDEKPAMDLLIQTLLETETGIRIDAALSSVKESKVYFSTNPDADIIFSDVQLSDGHSFEIFKNMHTGIPVVFTTGYDEFVADAFSSNGIDYLLKPINKKDVIQSLEKYKALKKHFTESGNPLQNLIRHYETPKKTRIVVRKGLEYLTLRLQDIVLLYTENKLVYIIDKLGKKYIGDKNLSEMEAELDNNFFFRANRQYIINLEHIKGFKPFEKVKIAVEMMPEDIQQQIIISQENASQFRSWIQNV